MKLFLQKYVKKRILLLTKKKCLLGINLGNGLKKTTESNVLSICYQWPKMCFNALNFWSFSQFGPAGFNNKGEAPGRMNHWHGIETLSWESGFYF